MQTHLSAEFRDTTEGREAGIPHYYVDEAEVRRLLAGFEFVRFIQVEEIRADHSSWHYYVLAQKAPSRA